MEQKVEQPKQNNITLVHKGFFYYIFYIVSLPFKALFYLLKQAWRYISIYLGWVKDYNIAKKKQEDLNKTMSRNKLEGDIY